MAEDIETEKFEYLSEDVVGFGANDSKVYLFRATPKGDGSPENTNYDITMYESDADSVGNKSSYRAVRNLNSHIPNGHVVDSISVYQNGLKLYLYLFTYPQNDDWWGNYTVTHIGFNVDDGTFFDPTAAMKKLN